MSTLELARQAYAKLKALRNGHAEGAPYQSPPYDINDRNDKRQNPRETPSKPCPRSHDQSPAAGPKRLLVRDGDGLVAVAQALDNSVAVGLDLETTGLDPRTDRVRLLALSVPTIDGGTFCYVVDTFQVDPRPLFPYLADRPVIAHNAAFDIGFLAALGFEPGAVRDTLLLSQLLHGTRQGKGFHTLGECVARELGSSLDKEPQTSDWAGVLTREQLDYAARDVEVLAPLYRALEAKVRAAGLEAVADIEQRCLPAMVWLARSGVAFDRDAWDALAREAHAEAEDLAGQLEAAAPERPGRLSKEGAWDWDSPQQVKAALAATGCPVDCTQDEALAAVDHPLAGLLRKYRAARKRCTTYGRDWTKHVAPDGRVYSDWRQLGADSGRMSSSDPNLQNLPRDPRYRACFRAPPRRVLVKADHSQIELRIAARIAGDEAMLAAYRDGQDLHTLTARRVLGIRDVSKEHRQLAKALNFGLLYGMGAKGFRIYARSNYGLDLSEDEARQYRESFFRLYPGLAAWHRRAGRSGKQAVETRTLPGRRRLGVGRFTEKLNTPVQGTGADGLKLALALLWERRHQVPGAFPVLVVHDEIVVECDADKAEAAAAWLRQAMLDGMPWLDPVPVEVEVKAAPTWGG
jgi:DNA polymerase-1